MLEDTVSNRKTVEADVVIVGGGPAGLTAGIYASRGQLDTIVLEKGLPGGQIAQTEDVENYPGFPETITGPELSQRMVAQAETFGARILMEEGTCLQRRTVGSLRVEGCEQDYLARSGTLAPGANPRRPGVPG